jgi:hypothetical protein
MSVLETQNKSHVNMRIGFVVPGFLDKHISIVDDPRKWPFMRQPKRLTGNCL